MKKKFYKIVIVFVFSFVFIFTSGNKVGFADSEKVFLGGFTAGFSIDTRGAEVIGVNDVITEKGLISPAKRAGIEIGDVIYSINGFEVNSALDIEKTLVDCNEKIIIVK